MWNYPRTKQIVVDEEEYQQFEAYKKLIARNNIIKIKLSLPEEVEFACYWNGDKCELLNTFGKDVLPEVRNRIKLNLDRKLQEVNDRIKEFTLLKAEIEVLKKSIKPENNDTQS